MKYFTKKMLIKLVQDMAVVFKIRRLEVDIRRRHQAVQVRVVQGQVLDIIRHKRQHIQVAQAGAVRMVTNNNPCHWHHMDNRNIHRSLHFPILVHSLAHSPVSMVSLRMTRMATEDIFHQFHKDHSLVPMGNHCPARMGNNDIFQHVHQVNAPMNQNLS